MAPLNQSNSTKPEMSKLKRLLFVKAAAGSISNSSTSKDELKMCTWSPYTSYECPDYGGQRLPFHVKDKSKSAQKSLDELRF